MKKQVLIADADKNFRNDLVAALESSDEFEVVGVATDGEQVLHVLQTKQADVLVMDLLLPRVDGLTILEHVNSMINPPKVLIVSAFFTQYVAVTAVRMGARQLMIKPCNKDVILKALRRMEKTKTGESAAFLWNGEKSKEELITNVLHDIGVPANIKGHHYLREAILLAINDMEVRTTATKDLYTQVAKTFQTTHMNVERAIRTAIELAWNRGDLDTLQRYFGYTVRNIGQYANSIINLLSNHPTIFQLLHHFIFLLRKHKRHFFLHPC